MYMYVGREVGEREGGWREGGRKGGLQERRVTGRAIYMYMYMYVGREGWREGGRVTGFIVLMFALHVSFLSCVHLLLSVLCT